MDYDVIASKERLTGRAYFNPGIVGGTGITSMPWLDLGNIQMMNLDYGIKHKEHYKARRGVLIADRFDAYSATPRWEITGDEFVSATLFLIFLGTAAVAVTQNALINQTTNFNSHDGGVLDIGKYALYNVTVAGATEGTHFICDRGPGKLYVPFTSPWAENSAQVVTWSCPAITYDRILPPLSNLNRTGTMQIFEEDDSAPPTNSLTPSPKTLHSFPASLSTDSGGQTKVDDYKSFKMIATITDPTNWIILKRSG